ncbi:hypothetical protein C1H46_027310 [Malus baccata]|uniref:Transmembrane protein n=1 Tax=Malus baccata TaxID=106549 RepID=A0A540LL35_MALBA|nr:hypothetical protein C1H46_027310 [Malus baccata]
MSTIIWHCHVVLRYHSIFSRDCGGGVLLGWWRSRDEGGDDGGGDDGGRGGGHGDGGVPMLVIVGLVMRLLAVTVVVAMVTIVAMGVEEWSWEDGDNNSHCIMVGDEFIFRELRNNEIYQNLGGRGWI